MNQIKFPALIGDSPLAVLAAIGTLRLVHRFVDDQARLSWDPQDHCPVLTTALPSLEAVASAVADLLQQMPAGVVVPGCPSGFPPPGVAPDRLRVPPGELPVLASRFTADASAVEAAEVRAWLASLVTDLAVDGDGRGAISQFTAPSGKQSMATMLEKPLEHVRQEPDYLRQGLRGWRRIPKVTGEYLDHRALWDAAEDGRGSAEMRGVPGATWLALMSFPLWMTTASGRHARTSGWHAIVHGRRIRQELRLPLWHEPLGPTAITALVEHPVFEGWAEIDQRTARQLKALGVFHVCRARRHRPPGGKSAGVLTPVR